MHSGLLTDMLSTEEGGEASLPAGKVCLTALKCCLTNRENWLGSLLTAGVPSQLNLPRNCSLLWQRPHTFFTVSIELEWRL